MTSTQSIKSMKLYTHVERVERELDARGLGSDQMLEAEQLADLDQLHYQGSKAVNEAIVELELGPGDRVLDVGAGLGGPARILAQNSGCQVTAVELQPDLNDLAASLTRRCGLARRIDHCCGDFLDMDLPSEGFDALVSWLTFLHIPENETLLTHCHRCLRPGGSIFIEDFYARPTLDAAQRDLLASEVYCCDLPTLDQYRQQIESAGFSDLQMTDMTAPWQQFVRQRLDAFRQARPQFEALHGGDAYCALDHFYAVIAGLFDSGGLGGLRWKARRPD